MPERDREKWNGRYLGEECVPAPSPFLLSLDDVLPRRGRALDVAGGSGRHALWLARRGLDVTLADVSDVALARASAQARAEGLALRTLETDLEASPLPAGPWDLVVCTYFLHRPLFAELRGALAPGGLLVVAHATRKNLERHPRPGPEHVLEEGELARLVLGGGDEAALAHGLETIRLDEGWSESGRHEARAVVRKRGAPGERPG